MPLRSLSFIQRNSKVTDPSPPHVIVVITSLCVGGLDFLMSKASSGIYNSIYPKLLKRARQLNVAMKPGFGERPKTEHPDIAATAAALGSVEVD